MDEQHLAFSFIVSRLLLHDHIIPFPFTLASSSPQFRQKIRGNGSTLTPFSSDDLPMTALVGTDAADSVGVFQLADVLLHASN